MWLLAGHPSASTRNCFLARQAFCPDRYSRTFPWAQIGAPLGAAVPHRGRHQAASGRGMRGSGALQTAPVTLSARTLGLVVCGPPPRSRAPTLCAGSRLAKAAVRSTWFSLQGAPHCGLVPRAAGSVSAAMFSGSSAPSRRVAPGPGQESVWDYPRPPRLEKVNKRIEIVFNGAKLADSTRTYRVLETSHPPVYYIPQADIGMEHVMKSAGGSSFCEWKGRATYWTVSVDGKTAKNVGWSYESPTTAFAPITSHIAFYCAPMDACLVDGERAQPQPGGFYGGWITKDIVGPFKGGAGSWGW